MGTSEGRYVGKVKIAYARVPMRDGVELSVKITRPDSEEKFPAIMEYNPYRRQRKPPSDYRNEYPPVVPYLAEHGYAIVQYDVRGTGNSGGWSTDMYSDQERQDGYDMIEWIAAQPWCDGNVGMIGKSYSAVVQWQVAAQNPPHLKAIIVRSAGDNIYTEWVYPGGALRPYIFDSYSPLMTAYNFAPPDPEIVGEKWSEIWQQRLEKNRPWGIGYITHPLDGPYWQDRSLSADYNRVKCAVLMIEGWADVYPTAMLRAFSKLKTPKKIIIGPWGHWYPEEKQAVPGPRIDTRPIYLRWFDYWLKGIDNGIMDEPPVAIFVREYTPPAARMRIEEKGFWRSESEWPIARTQYTPLYLHPEGKLSQEPYTGSGDECDEYAYNPAVGITSGIHWGGGILPWGMPIDQRLDEAYSLTYTTQPLEKDLEVTGVPAAVLYVSSSADVAYFMVKIIDVAPDGASKLVSYGGLNATHRSSHFHPEPLNPGEIYELRIELSAIAYVFSARHRIRVAIASADIQNAWPTPKAAINAIYRSGKYQSHIVLPIVTERSRRLPEPHFELLPNADPKSLPTPLEHSLIHDMVNRTITVRLTPVHVLSQPGYNIEQQSSFTVSLEKPAEAALKARCAYKIAQLGSEIRVEADELLVSDMGSFRYLVQVEITVNGRRNFDRSWSVTVPRLLC